MSAKIDQNPKECVVASLLYCAVFWGAGQSLITPCLRVKIRDASQDSVIFHVNQNDSEIGLSQDFKVFPMEQLSQHWSNSLSDGLLASSLASLGTGIGALPVLFTAQLSDRTHNLLLSIGSGVMLSAAAFSLLLPATELASHQLGLALGILVVALSLTVGASLFYGLSHCLPKPELDNSAPGIWLFVLAIALHHFPEGLAVGLSTASTQDWTVAIGVGVQNLPEGLMVALALRELGYGAVVALGFATVSGWLEPLGGLLGASLAGMGTTMIAPMGMALAAGAMLFVVLHELLPELHLQQLRSSAGAGLITGLLVMGLVEQMV